MFSKNRYGYASNGKYNYSKMMLDATFYDENPFEYGYSSKQEIVANMNPLLKDLMQNNAGNIFCDVGCGCGRNLLYASNFASRLIGVDLSVDSLNFARNFVKSNNLELIHGNNLDIPLDSNTFDLVVSDGVCHHTGDTVKAFSECIRILKPGGSLYLAVYKKFRYYPVIYYVIGGVFRVINKFKIGKYLIDKIFVPIHYMMYKMFKKQKLSIIETRNIFYDYFITPVATFHSRGDVDSWCRSNNSDIINYARTSGNCHVFIIRKND